MLGVWCCIVVLGVVLLVQDCLVHRAGRQLGDMSEHLMEMECRVNQLEQRLRDLTAAPATTVVPSKPPPLKPSEYIRGDWRFDREL